MNSSPHIFSSKDFISIVITSFFRPYYLKKCLETLHKMADMPFEVIVTDDGSDPEIQKEILNKYRDQVSTFVFNTGINMGLNVSANRAVNLCQSDNIFFMNDDCEILKPCFKSITKALDAPFIGWISPPNEFEGNPALSYTSAGDKITANITGGYSIAFRKEVWKEVGGWSENNTTGQSDNVFITKIIRAGYFKGLLANGPVIRSIDPNSADYVQSYSYTGGYDCAYPRLFGPGVDLQFNKDISHKRREYCQWWVDGQRTIPNRATFDDRSNPTAGLNDLGYWGDYMKTIVDEANGLIYLDNMKHGAGRWTEDTFIVK